MSRFILILALCLVAKAATAKAETFPVIQDQVVLKECGDCHMAFPPQTLTRAVWRNILNTLSNHFGEDARLDADLRKHLLAYYEAHASDVSDTRAAMKWTADVPFTRLTEAPRFQNKHGGCSPEVWKHNRVKSKSNCQACHTTMQTDGSTDADIRFLSRTTQAQCNAFGAVGVLVKELFNWAKARL